MWERAGARENLGQGKRVREGIPLRRPGEVFGDLAGEEIYYGEVYGVVLSVCTTSWKEPRNAREPAYIEPLLLIYSLRKYKLPAPAAHWEPALNITQKATVLVELNSSRGCRRGT